LSSKGRPAPEPICLSQRHSVHVAKYYHSDILQKSTCYSPFSSVAASAEPLVPLPRLGDPSPLATPTAGLATPLHFCDHRKSLLLPLLLVLTLNHFTHAALPLPLSSRALICYSTPSSKPRKHQEKRSPILTCQVSRNYCP
jgi:hypothetical protein